MDYVLWSSFVCEVYDRTECSVPGEVALVVLSSLPEQPTYGLDLVCDIT